MSRSGADLARLLLGAYRRLVDDTVVELAARGHPDIRPVHELALRAVDAGAVDTSSLGRQLQISKQAAAKTVAVLLEHGYLQREPDPVDRRRMLLQVTPHGRDLLRQGEYALDELRSRWEAAIGSRALADLEAHLTSVIGATPPRGQPADEPM